MAEWNFRISAKVDDDGQITKMTTEPLVKDWAQWDAEHPYIRGEGRVGGGSVQHGDYTIHPATVTSTDGEQTNLRIASTDKDGNEVGHLEYSTVGHGEDLEMHIQHIGTDQSAQGSGLATGMAQQMRDTHPESNKVDPGMTTDEGAKWWNSRSMDSVRGEMPPSKDDELAQREEDERGATIPGTDIHVRDNFDYNALTPDQQQFVRDNQ